MSYYSMFTDEGNACVADAYAKVTSRDFPLTVTAPDVVEMITSETILLGFERRVQVGEVHDTAVRESIWNQLERDFPALVNKVT